MYLAFASAYVFFPDHRLDRLAYWESLGAQLESIFLSSFVYLKRGVWPVCMPLDRHAITSVILCSTHVLQQGYLYTRSRKKRVRPWAAKYRAAKGDTKKETGLADSGQGFRGASDVRREVMRADAG